MNQEEALKILKMGTNVFLTGAPGAGKTYVLNKYIDFLYQCGVNVAITASTGIAATHIGGSTIHSWSGIGIKKYLTEVEIDRLTQNERLYKRYQDTQVLVIDEISMLGAMQFEMIDTLARRMRRSSKPFGGMQIVLSGDFFQLPPVVRSGDDTRFAFESESWNDLRPVICYLAGSHRHKDDALGRILNAIRRKDISNAEVRKLFDKVSDSPDEMENRTRLYTHNVDVDAENELRLSKLRAPAQKYEMRSRGKKALVKSLKNWCLAPEELLLKEGAEVMFVKNDPARRYVNGTRGTVVGTENSLPVVKTLSGKEVVAEYVNWAVEEDGKFAAEIEQVPLRLAWAITVHKSQGMTLDEAHMDLSKSFAPGQGYVALSRIRDISGLYLSGISEKALWVDDRAAMVDQEFIARSESASRRLAELGEEEISEKIKKFVKESGGKMPSEEQADKGRKDKMSESLRNERMSNTKSISTYEKTKELVGKKLPIAEIAKERNLKKTTIISHLEKLIDDAETDLSYLTSDLRKNIPDFAKMQLAFEHLKKFKLSPVKKYLEENGVEADFDELRLARLMLSREKFRSLKKSN